MNLDEMCLLERQQAAKVELSLIALNNVAKIDSALLEVQHRATTPKQVVAASRKRKRMKILVKKLMEAI